MILSIFEKSRCYLLQANLAKSEICFHDRYVVWETARIFLFFLPWIKKKFCLFMLLSKRSPPCWKHLGGLRLSRRTWCSSKYSKELDHAWPLPWRQRHSWNPAGEGQRAITQCFTSLGEHEGFLSCRHQRDWRLPAGGWRKCCNTCLTVLWPVKPRALSSGWVCFSPPESTQSSLQTRHGHTVPRSPGPRVSYARYPKETARWKRCAAIAQLLVLACPL